MKKNKVIGAVIVLIYFLNYHICELIYPNDINCWIKLKISIYCIIILLAIEYKKKDTFLEKLFCAVIFNNIYVLLFRDETGYTFNDIIFIASFTAIQYVKYLYNLYKQWLNNY
jgi:hypothetical protein